MGLIPFFAGQSSVDSCNLRLWLFPSRVLHLRLCFLTFSFFSLPFSARSYQSACLGQNFAITLIRIHEVQYSDSNALSIRVGSSWTRPISRSSFFLIQFPFIYGIISKLFCSDSILHLCFYFFRLISILCSVNGCLMRINFRLIKHNFWDFICLFYYF